MTSQASYECFFKGLQYSANYDGEPSVSMGIYVPTSFVPPVHTPSAKNTVRQGHCPMEKDWLQLFFVLDYHRPVGSPQTVLKYQRMLNHVWPSKVCCLSSGEHPSPPYSCTRAASRTTPNLCSVQGSGVTLEGAGLYSFLCKVSETLPVLPQCAW